MAENKLSAPVIGLIMDGTGYGTDGTIWGGEVFIGDYAKAMRFAHFEPMPLPGGDAAIKAPWRIAASYLYKAFGETIPDLPLLQKNDALPIIEMVRRNFNSPLTSSLGRLFDAVAAISGGKPVIRYEGQAAIEFMQQADSLDVPPFESGIIKSQGARQLSVTELIRNVVHAVKNGESVSRLSSRFHRTLIEIFKQIAKEARAETGIQDVVLSGGVFQNMILFEGLIPALEKEGFRVYTHQEVPTTDGGLSLGQALIGREFLNNRYEGIQQFT
ncbi:MAG: hypothetical protein HGB11_13685 [Chlorobiales bacterium]|nr:hypothetical protein [Chlorobiales bacterium]